LKDPLFRHETEHTDVLKVLMALRLFKIVKLPQLHGRLQRMCEEAQIDSSIFNMFTALMVLLLVFHYIGCFYWHISEAQGFCTGDFQECLIYWSPSVEIVETADLKTQYAQSLYWTIQATGVGRDIIPRTNVEAIFTIFVMVSTTLFQRYFVCLIRSFVSFL
jgi:hypothetical protein